jgi:hypothetical protein
MSLNDGISVNSAPSDGAAPPLPLPPPAALQVSDTVTAEEDSDGTNTAEYYYTNEGCCLKILVAMCHGLCDDDGNPVLSLDSTPWKSFPVSQIRPNRDGYGKEVIRRWRRENHSSDSTKGPRPKQWNLVKIHEWLEQNVIVNAADIAFVKDTVASRKEVAEAAQRENDEDNARLGAGNWNSDACMRLIHALVDHDEIKAKFLNRLNLPAGRSSVENREQLRATDVWHLMADKWNDKVEFRR